MVTTAPTDIVNDRDAETASAKGDEHVGTGSKRGWGLTIGAMVSSLGIAVLVNQPALAAAETSGAYGASARVMLAGIAVDVPPVPSVGCSGDSHSTSLASVDLGGDSSLHSTASLLDTACSGNTASADVADVNLFDGLVHATVLHSSCDGSSAHSSIATLSIKDYHGTTFTVSGNGSVVVDISPLDKATITLDDQSTNAAGEIVVDALHVKVAGPLSNDDIVLAQSRCAAGQPGANVPEAPFSILMLTAGAAVVGGAALVRRRRTAG